MEQVHQCWWRICREINVFSSFEYHMFYVLYPCVTYLLILPFIYSLLMFSSLQASLITAYPTTYRPYIYAFITLVKLLLLFI
jgi:hypothetical protein